MQFVQKGVGDWVMGEKKCGERFWGDQQPCELVLRGNQDPNLCLLISC